jgi:hypothetical protein
LKAPPQDQWIAPALAGVCGLVVMTAALGPSVVHPANIDWLMRGDFSLQFLGWHLYRTGPWTLPLGATPHLIWPVGSSVGLTDSIPIAAFFFKLLDAILPPIFQFVGIWLVTCFALQGVFGALVTGLATRQPVLQVLGGLLFVLSPPLITRFGHAALSAHWVLLAALWLSLRYGADRPSVRRAAGWAALAAVTAAIQPYLLLMVVVLMSAAHARQIVSAPREVMRIARHLALGLAGAWVGLWQSGSLMVPSGDGLAIGGFGGYSANLLTFIMPTEGRTLFSPGPIPYASSSQYEGYAYLGAGALLLGLVALGAVVVSRDVRDVLRPDRRHLPLLMALVALSLMAVGPVVTAGPRTLLTYDAEWWGPLRTFRSNGRMIWPFFYAVATAIVFAVVRLRHQTALRLMLAAVLFQAVDLAGMTGFVGEVRTRGYRDPLNSRFWQVAPPHYERLVMFPSNVCDRDGRVDYLPFSLIAGRHGLAINAGSTARYDVRRAASYCVALEQEVLNGMGTPGSMYIVRPDLLPRLAPQAEARGSMCRVIDGFGVCFSVESYREWRERFELPPAS